MNARNKTNIKRRKTSRKIRNIEKGNKNAWNNFEQERRINNRKLTICFVQKEGKGIKMKETIKEKVERWGEKRKWGRIKQFGKMHFYNESLKKEIKYQ